ncbi:hypothetical protein B0I35DRAFT_158161 [Stachybotrys elegans]|uniref:Uncharacterized protein n=1 Tax=Stachybotrys elegans TaxID=80388 RepID=A0A8K0WTF5_9HYPO|nr:hypothetical protein B0I35DRAFT_158161 [Stachybotrys elegans]
MCLMQGTSFQVTILYPTRSGSGILANIPQQDASNHAKVSTRLSARKNKVRKIRRSTQTALLQTLPRIARRNSFALLGWNTRRSRHRNTSFYVHRPAVDSYDTTHVSFAYPRHAVLNPDDDPSPLCARGWVLEKTILSPRTFHFAFNEITWRCQSAVQRECSPGFTDRLWNGQFPSWHGPNS